jgi:hypothetical protein
MPEGTGSRRSSVAPAAFGWVIILLLGIAQVGCSKKDKLDDETAKKAVNSMLDDKARIETNIGRVGTDCIQFFLNGEEVSTSLDPGKDPFTFIAEQAGYFKETSNGPGFWTVSLTDKGEKAVAAGDIKLKPVPPRKGCDYQNATLILGRTELDKIDRIVSGEDSTQIDYTYRWRLTDLGRTMRQDGSIYKLLDEDQRKFLARYSHGHLHVFPIPAPDDSYTESENIRVKKYPEGWQLMPDGYHSKVRDLKSD